MGGLRGLLLAVASCTATPLGVPGAPRPVACERATTPGIAAAQLAVAPSASGATIVWAGVAGLMRFELDASGGAAGPPVVAWPGAFDRASAASVEGELVVGAVAGEVTTLLGAPLGVGDYRELAVLGGIGGASPVVVAGGARLAPTVSYGGLFVASIDALWTAHTAQLAVLTPNATEVAAVAAGDEAVIAWPAGGACFVERAGDATSGTASQAAGACASPRLASLDGGVALAFERDGGVYLAVASSPGALQPERAIAIAPGAHAPRLVAADGAYWMSYADADGAVVAGFVDAEGALQSVSLGAASAYELAVIAGAPRVVAIDDGGLTVTALCAE